MLHRPNWYTRRGITLHSGDPIVEIDRKRRMVRSQNGTVAPYDRLLIATGSDPIVLPLPGKDLPGVVTFRDLDDVNRMLERSGAGRRAVVIGGGLLGLEAAHGLALRGMHVTVVHLLDTLMERQLDAPAGALLKAALEKRGIEFRMRAKTQEILGGERVTGVKFDNGDEVAGGPRGHGGRRAAEHRAREEGAISPATAASSSTTRCRPTTRPSTRSASACSTAARPSAWWRRCGSRRASARSTSPRSACRASRAPSMPRSSRCPASKCFPPAISPRRPNRESLVLSDKRRGVYKRVVLEGNKVCGAVLFGDVREASRLRDLIADGTDIGPIRDQLLFDSSAAA